MYTVDVVIEGTSPLLQHRFGPERLDKVMGGATRNTGSPDYSMEWLDTMYVTDDGHLYQPATHLEGALVKAAGTFKVKGARGKTWRDPIRAYCYVQPSEVVHMHDGEPVRAPGPELISAPNPHLSVSVMRVLVQRSAVARSRLQIAAGWQLAFTLEVHDEQVRPDVVREILGEAGRAAGIGDFRPRYGRFKIVEFAVNA